MSIINVNPTAMELGKLKKRLKIAQRGHHLLKDKLDELMRQFLILVNETKKLRMYTEEKTVKLQKTSNTARFSTKPQIFDDALSSPFPLLDINVKQKNIMNVQIPCFSYYEPKGIYSFGYAFTSTATDTAANMLLSILPHLIKLAQNEKAITLIAAEIETVRRRVNALEHILIPNLTDTIRYIKMKLEESDRSARTRLIKVKDLVLENQGLSR